LKQDVEDLGRTDLEEETILDVMRILKEEFDSQISSTINMPLYTISQWYDK
jgi:hypothetical protein